MCVSEQRHIAHFLSDFTTLKLLDKLYQFHLELTTYFRDKMLYKMTGIQSDLFKGRLKWRTGIYGNETVLTDVILGSNTGQC